MHLTELKNMPVSDLVKLGEDQMGLENLARLRKQDIVFAGRFWISTFGGQFLFSRS